MNIRAIFQQVVSNIKITEEEKNILLKADKILKDIFKTLDTNDYIGDDMSELFNSLEPIDLEYITHMYLELE